MRGLQPARAAPTQGHFIAIFIFDSCKVLRALGRAGRGEANEAPAPCTEHQLPSLPQGTRVGGAEGCEEIYKLNAKRQEQQGGAGSYGRRGAGGPTWLLVRQLLKKRERERRAVKVALRGAGVPRGWPVQPGPGHTQTERDGAGPLAAAVLHCWDLTVAVPGL